MKKVLLLFFLLAAAAVGLLAFFPSSGQIASNLAPSLSADSRYLQQRSVDFLEDLQFKDFDKAASYHRQADREKVDIPKLIERMFKVKPEALDIMRYEVKKVEIDRSGDRARVKTHTVIKLLNTKRIERPEIMLYWQKDPIEGWVMVLESSLR